jgi:hypothetical protein
VGPSLPAIWAEIASDGTIVHDHAVQSVTKTGTGVYEIDSFGNLSNCSVFGTIGDPPPATGAPGFIRGANTPGNASAVTIWTYKKDGIAADYPFQVAVVC